MATTGHVQKPSLQNLYDRTANDIVQGSSTNAAQDIQRAAALYGRQNPGATVADFENAFAAAEKGKISSSQINQVVNHILPAGDDPATTGVSALAHASSTGSIDKENKHHGGGGGAPTATTTSTMFDPSTGQIITVTSPTTPTS